MVCMTQALCGTAITGYVAYFFLQAGFSTARAFDLSTGMYGLAIIAGGFAWIWMHSLPRRTWYITSCAMCFIIMPLTGIVGCLRASSAQSHVAVGVPDHPLHGPLLTAPSAPVCYGPRGGDPTHSAEGQDGRPRTRRVQHLVAGEQCRDAINMLNPTALGREVQGLFCLGWPVLDLALLDSSRGTEGSHVYGA